MACRGRPRPWGDLGDAEVAEHQPPEGEADRGQRTEQEGEVMVETDQNAQSEHAPGEGGGHPPKHPVAVLARVLGEDVEFRESERAAEDVAAHHGTHAPLGGVT